MKSRTIFIPVISLALIRHVSCFATPLIPTTAEEKSGPVERRHGWDGRVILEDGVELDLGTTGIEREPDIETIELRPDDLNGAAVAALGRKELPVVINVVKLPSRRPSPSSTGAAGLGETDGESKMVPSGQQACGEEEEEEEGTGARLFEIKEDSVEGEKRKGLRVQEKMGGRGVVFL
ncbi:hypothetical protein MKZ38_001313 [Zalerion maritima]|uniref:Uncharacterized protein n=1 Tax=Zalerion maritima TaxID=339359 RepID=A0AAD5RS11_9PEZI|nr:hypothetical protein MKZ38_001313 [Zalerion maritima]